MAKVEYINLTGGGESLYFSQLRPGDRFEYSRVVKKETLLSKKKKIDLAGRSLFGIIAEDWASLSASEKDDWKDAADEVGLTNWQLFVQDTAARMARGLSGVATPSTLYQSYVGQIQISNPATEIKITQIHPHSYYVRQKVSGTKSQYSPVQVTEDFSLPLALSLNYKSDLSSVGPDPYASFYANIWYSYQGRDLFYTLEIPLDLVTDWKSGSNSVSSLDSYIVRYDLFFHLHDVQGDLFFDNIKAEHSGQNWVRDPYCVNINEGFTRAFYQVPKHWAAVILPDGALYDSVYKDF